MALISIDLAWEEDARITQTGSERNVWYKAVCSSVFDSDREILLGAPSKGAKILPFSPDPKNPARLVSEVAPRRIPGSSFFDVQVTYSTDVSIADNPLAEPAKITIKGQRREIVWFYDAKGRPKMNTAGDLIGDPAPVKPVTDLIFSVEKNMALKLEAWLLDYLDTVNSDTVRLRGLICPPGTLLFAGDIDVGDEQNTDGQKGQGGGGQQSVIKLVPFTVVKFQLLYRADGWTTIVPNRGFNQVVALKNETVPPAASGDFQAPKPPKQPKFKYRIERITIGDPADYPTEPQFLDSNGMLIQNPTPDNILLLEFDDFEERPFNQLPLK